MAGSTYGTIFKLTTWGESHGNGVGVVIDGCPAGLSLSEEDIQAALNRRKPGQTIYSTPRKENDEVEILSGVFKGVTTGTPISLIVKNENQRSRDYGNLAYTYRPGHADYTFDKKYGIRDYRGGGRSSGRETIGRVAAGAIATKFLKELGISFTTYSKSIGPIVVEHDEYEYSQITQNPLYMPHATKAKEAELYLQNCMQAHDSSGGSIECVISGVPIGLGEPVFEKLDAALSKAVMSIGSVKGIEIGSGFSVSSLKGSTINDCFFSENDSVKKASNHAGGILGGMSDGSDIILHAAIKPTPSIGIAQKTITDSNENVEISIGGRHDPIIVPRAVVVVEAMAAVTIADFVLLNMSSRLDRIRAFYQAD